MANKYEDLIDQGAVENKGSIAAGSNKYADILDSEEQQLQQSAFVAGKGDPDKRAQSIKMGKQVGLPSDVVERNFDKVKSQADMMAFKPSSLLKNAPGLSRWLQSPDNAVVGKDDLDNLENVEKKIQDHSLASSLWTDFYGGVQSMIAGAAQVPALNYDTLVNYGKYLPGALGKLGQVADAAVKSGAIPDRAPEGLRNNPVAVYFNKKAEENKTEFIDMSLWDEAVNKGNYALAGRIAVQQAVRSFPNTIVTLGSYYMGGAGVGTAAVGAIAGAQKASQLAEQNPDVSAKAATANALATGTSEALTEYLPLGFLDKMIGGLAKTVGKQAALEAAKSFALTMAKGAGAEFTEEYLNSVAEDLVDLSTGVNKEFDPGKTFGSKAISAGVVGSISGGMMTGPSGYAAAAIKYKATRQAEEDRELFLALGESVEQTKLHTRLPEAKRALVEEMTKNGPVENIYIPREKFIEYFQSKKESPANIAETLGVSKELNEAETTGKDIKIPTAVWAEKMIGTEHHQALANDIKFNPEGLTVNEAKESEKEFKETEKEASKVTSEETKISESAREVKKRVTDMLVQSGVPKRDASAQAAIYESTFKSLGMRSKQDPLELFNKYGLTINGRTQDGTVLNQGGKLTDLERDVIAARIKEIQAKIDSDHVTETDKKLLLREIEKIQERQDQSENYIDVMSPEDVSSNPLIEVGQQHKPQDTDEDGNTVGAEIEFNYRLNNADEIYYAVRDDKVVGHLGIKDGAVETVYVDEQYRRSGIAEKLYLDYANKNGELKSGSLFAMEPETKKLWAKFKKKYPDRVSKNKDGYVLAGDLTVDNLLENTDARLPMAEIKVSGLEVINVDNISNLGSISASLRDYEILDGVRSIDMSEFDLSMPTFYSQTESDRVNALANEIKKNKQIEPVIVVYDEKGPYILEGGHRFDALKILKKKSIPALVVIDKSTKTNLFQDTRGKISFGADRKFNIELLKDANLSTFLHETGHFYLEILGDLAEASGADQQIKDDYAALLNWFGVTSRDQIKVEHHEQFARGFETYLMEGKAPSSKLRRIFAKFKVWLTSVYKSFLELDVQLSDEVRSVMDRLVATEEEIAHAQAELNQVPMFADPVAAGMSEAQSANYIEAREEARLFAEEKVTQQLMEAVARKRTQEYKERRKQVKAEVTAQVDQMNVVKAQSILQRGKMPDGSALPEGTPPIKLDRQSLVDSYGAEFVKNLPKPYIYVREGGMHQDAAASILQFEDGDALIQAIVNTPPRSEVIEQMVNERMDSIYPDMLTDGSLPQAAVDSVINERMAYVNRLELEWLQSYEPAVTKDLTRKIGRRRLPTSEQMKEQARQLIGDRAVGDIKPHLYLRAHVKYHNEALKLFTRGDIDAAFESKRKSVINEALYNQALLAKADVKKSIQFFKRLNKKDEDVAKTRDVDLVNAARAVLAQFGLDRTDKTADEYLKKMAEYDPDRYNSIKAIVDSATQAAGPYNTVRYDDFVAMKDAVESLWSLAKSSKEIEIDGKKVDIDAAKEELLVKIVETSSKQPKSEYNKTADKHDKFKVKLLGARASLTRVETWADVMDVTYGGPFRRYIWQPISDATLKYRQSRLDILGKYEKLLRGYEKNLSKEKIKSDELRFVFDNKAELMMAVLHSGNDSNLHKLLVGRGWGAVNPDGSLDRTAWDKFINRMQDEGVLQKADFDFAQSIWDLLDSMKPETQKAHKQMYGYYFNEVTANAVSTQFGSYRGGYVPAKVDTYANEDAAIRREREEFEKNNNSYAYPTTGRGFTKSRVESYAAPLSLDMNLLGSHIDGVMRFTYIEPRVKEVSRLVMDKRFRKALAEIDQTVAKDTLIPWLQRAAQQQVVMPSNDGLGKALDGIAGVLRANAAVQIMFGNITNTLQQATGMVVAMAKVKPRYIRNSLARYIASPKKTSDAVLEKSAWMKSNQDSSIYEISNSINEVILNPSTFQKFKTFTKKHTYFLQAHAQNIVNAVVWQGAYDQSTEQGMDDKAAIKYADSVVRTTQGSNRPEDMSRFETGTKTELLFKQFVGYFNMLANLNTGELMKIQRQVGLKKGAGKAFYIYMMGLAIPAILSDAIVMAMSGKGLDQDDDDEYLDDILKSFFGSQFKTIAATIPYGGQFMTAAYNRAFTDSRADDRMSLSPAISVLEGAVGTPVEVYKNIAGDVDNEKKITKDALTLLGVITGLPTGPVGKPVGYLMDVQSGKAEPTGPIDFTRGLMTGKAGQ